MVRGRGRSKNVILFCAGLGVPVMGDIEKGLASLQTAVRLKCMKLPVEGGSIHIASVTCDPETVTMMERSGNILILQMIDAGQKTVKRRFHKKEGHPPEAAYMRLQRGGPFSIIDRKPEGFCLLPDEEAAGAVGSLWRRQNKNR